MRRRADPDAGRPVPARADLLAAPDGEPRPDGSHYEVVDAKLATGPVKTYAVGVPPTE